MGPIAPQLSAPNYNATEQKKGYGCFCAICGHDSLGLSWLRLSPSRYRHQPALQMRSRYPPPPPIQSSPTIGGRERGRGCHNYGTATYEGTPAAPPGPCLISRRGGGGGCADGRTPLFCAADLAAAFHPPSIPPVPSRLRRTAARVSVKQKSICAEKVSSLEPTLPAEDVERPGLNPGGRPGGCQPRKVLKSAVPIGTRSNCAPPKHR